MIRIIAMLLLFVASLADGLTAERKNILIELQPAQKALASGDYRKAYTLFSRFAGKNPLAQFELGLMHKNGWGRAVNPAEACRWFEKAAQGHIPVGQQFFGDCLAQGIDRSADSLAAIDWYKKAAGGGDLIALCSAADLYIKGQGVAKDVVQGLALCTQVAQGESPPAMIRLAHYYREGGDVEQNLPLARYWYQQAADRKSPEAQYHLGVMFSEGLGGDVDLNAALYWLETAASAGYAPAYLPTAILYANADVNPETGALAPEHLAKIYLWNSAAKARTTDAAQLTQITQIEQMVLSVMPPSWQPDLDKKVAGHLAGIGERNTAN